jgi:hypothetical protein
MHRQDTCPCHSPASTRREVPGSTMYLSGNYQGFQFAGKHELALTFVA